jgi:hypothetical protein
MADAGILSMLGLQIYDTPARSTLLADFTSRLAPSVGGGGLRFSTSRHGFAALQAPLVPLSPQESFMVYDWPGTPHCVVLDSAANLIWEGRLEDIAIVPDGVRLGAFGYWRALNDVLYTALWSKSGTAGWRQVTPQDLSGANNAYWEMDNNNRIRITAKNGESFQNGDGKTGRMTYAAPHSSLKTITTVTFTYSLTAPNSTWRAALSGRNDDFSGVAVEWQLDGNGATQTGTTTVTLATPRHRLDFSIRNLSASAQTVTATDQVGLTITGIRIKTTTAATVLASAIAASLAAYVNGVNSSQLSSSAALIGATTLDLRDEVYEDVYPADILERLATIHNYETGVWEDRRLHWRPRGSDGRHWYVDVTRIIEMERSLENLRNSAYTVYRDADGRRLRTAVANDSTSQDRYSIVRRGYTSAQTTSSTEAETHRDAFLSDRKDFAMRGRIEFDRLYDATGAEHPLYMLRAGDQVTMRNLSPTLSTAIDQIRSFLVGQTEYAAHTKVMAIEPRVAVPTLITLVARRSAGV